MAMQIIPYPNNDPDIIRSLADSELDELSREIYEIYRQAAEEVQKKADDYFSWFQAADENMKQKYIDGEITLKEYQNWRKSHMLTGKRWYELASVLAMDMTNADLIAGSVINGHLPAVYAIGYNYSLYQAEKQTMFTISDTLYNRRAVERMIRNNTANIKVTRVDRGIAWEWNQGHVQSAAMQGILQGEDMHQIARRIARNTDINQRAAMRNARTAVTSAENGGRFEAFQDVESAGFKVHKTWLATLDFRTRYTHRQLDRVTVEGADTEFENGCRYPGDPRCNDGSELYNCRCSVVNQVVPMDLSVKPGRNGKLGSMPYEEWKNAKGNETEFRKAKNEEKDRQQHEKYKDLNVEGVPAKFSDFQEVKYHSPGEWKKVKSDALSKQAQKRKKEKEEKAAKEAAENGK